MRSALSQRLAIRRRVAGDGGCWAGWHGVGGDCGDIGCWGWGTCLLLLVANLEKWVCDGNGGEA